MLNTIVGIIGTALLGIIAWAINVHSRVAVLEADKATAIQREAALKELLDVKLDAITVLVATCNARLDRIEKKLDKEE